LQVVVALLHLFQAVKHIEIPLRFQAPGEPSEQVNK